MRRLHSVLSLFLCLLWCSLWNGALFAQDADEAFEVAPDDSRQVLIETLERVIPPPSLGAKKADLPCLKCDGTGSIDTELRDAVSFEVFGEKKSLKKPCPVCKGRKKAVRELTLKERVARFQEKRRRYDKAQILAHNAPFGSAYIAFGAFDDLDPQTFVQVAAFFPEMCATCYGFAAVPCPACDSWGTDHYFDGQPCKKCKGVGAFPCKRCNATGVLKLCKTCKGVGVTKRKAKKNQPETLERCRSCKGFGRR